MTNYCSQTCLITWLQGQCLYIADMMSVATDMGYDLVFHWQSDAPCRINISRFTCMMLCRRLVCMTTCVVPVVSHILSGRCGTPDWQHSINLIHLLSQFVEFLWQSDAPYLNKISRWKGTKNLMLKPAHRTNISCWPSSPASSHFVPLQVDSLTHRGTLITNKSWNTMVFTC